MSDSDETICDEGEDHSQMSPSVLTPLVRTNYLDQNAVSCGSPEFLPPSAKVQRLANENEDQTRAESKRQYLNQEVQGSQMETTCNQEESVATERLKLLNAKKDKIEELLVIIEESVKRGTSLRDSPVLAKVKLLMAELKTQLADFTHFQQKQRQEIAESSHMSKDGKESQWTQEKKQKILDLATQQKELLKLLHCNKNLVEKVQKLKQMSKSGTKVILPMLEAHCKSQEMNVPQEKGDKHIHQAPATNTRLSNLNIHAKIITANSKITNASQQTLNQSVSRLGPAEPSCLTQVSSSTTTLIHGQMNSPTVIPSVSQASPLFAKTQPCLIASSNQTSTTAMCSKSMKTGSQTAVNMSARPQQKVQNAILKGGQLYQVGDKQIYVLPIGLTTDAASSQTTTQENEMPKGMSLIAPQPKTATLAVKEPLSKQGHVLPITSMVKSTQSLTLNTVSNLGSHLQTRISPQHSTCMTRDQNTKVTSANCITTALPTNSTQFPSTSSTFYQNTGVSTTTQFGSKGSEKTSETANAFATNEDSTVPMMQKSAKVQIQARKQLKITPHRSLQSTVSSCSQVSTAQVKNTSQTLQRKNSFGSDLPDIKSLLNHNVIRPGSHVLSVQFEGRNFEASLRASGLIESAGGETFRTPMAWMRAVTGSWNTVKQSQAYKMVHYKGTPLDLLTLPYVEKEPADSRDILNKNAENLAVALDGQGKIKDPIGLITCWDDVAQLLVNCRIMPIGINELVPLESVLPSNFWDSGKEADVHVPPSLLQELDF